MKNATPENPAKTAPSRASLARQAPFETREVGEVLSLAKALLRGKPSAEEASKMADRLTRLEDWVEMRYPQDDRSALQAARRSLEGEAQRKRVKRG